MIADKHTHRQTNMLITMLLLEFFWSIFAPPLLGYFDLCTLTFDPYWGGAKMQTYSLSTGDPLSN